VLKNRLNAPEASSGQHDAVGAFRFRKRHIDGRAGNGNRGAGAVAGDGAAQT